MKKYLKIIGAFFAKMFNGLKAFLLFLDEHVDDAILVVSNIRDAVNNPVVLSLLFFLPENLRSEIGEGREKALSIIDKVLAELLEGEECLQHATVFEKLKCFVAQLKGMSQAKQEAHYVKFSALYAKHSHGGSLPGRYYDTAAQSRFFEKRENINIA